MMKRNMWEPFNNAYICLSIAVFPLHGWSYQYGCFLWRFFRPAFPQLYTLFAELGQISSGRTRENKPWMKKGEMTPADNWLDVSRIFAIFNWISQPLGMPLLVSIRPAQPSSIQQFLFNLTDPGSLLRQSVRFGRATFLLEISHSLVPKWNRGMFLFCLGCRLCWPLLNVSASRALLKLRDSWRWLLLPKLIANRKFW